MSQQVAASARVGGRAWGAEDAHGAEAEGREVGAGFGSWGDSLRAEERGEFQEDFELLRDIGGG